MMGLIFEVGATLGFVLVGFVVLGFDIWMLVDAIQRPPEAYPSPDQKTWWIVALIVGLVTALPAIAVALAYYFIVRRAAATAPAPYRPIPSAPLVTPAPAGGVPMPPRMPPACRNCGAILVAGARFCHSCGAVV